MKIFRFSRRRSSPLVSITLLSVFFGLAAGGVGMLLVQAYLTPAPILPATVAVSSRDVVADPRQEVGYSPSLRDVARSRAVFYVGGADVTEREASVRLVGKAVGVGLVFTSDGWLISHSAVFADRGVAPTYFQVVVDGHTYTVASVVNDPFTGVSFVKIRAENLPVGVFDAGADYFPGASLFAFDAGAGLQRMPLIARGSIPPSSAEQAYRSSERLQKHFRFVSVPGVLPGTPVMDSDGRAVGIMGAAEGTVAAAVPFGAFFRQIGGILRDGRASRPYLGVHYIDLEEAVEIDLPVGRGALLASSARSAAVNRRSPAEEGGLREGDVILRVNEEQVSANRPLADLIAQYEPDRTVTLTVLRSGKEMTSEIVLGRVPE